MYNSVLTYSNGGERFVPCTLYIVHACCVTRMVSYSISGTCWKRNSKELVISGLIAFQYMSVENIMEISNCRVRNFIQIVFEVLVKENMQFSWNYDETIEFVSGKNRLNIVPYHSSELDKQTQSFHLYFTNKCTSFKMYTYIITAPTCFGTRAQYTARPWHLHIGIMDIRYKYRTKIWRMVGYRAKEGKENRRYSADIFYEYVAMWCNITFYVVTF
jgi:hypothetical protein